MPPGLPLRKVRASFMKLAATHLDKRVRDVSRRTPESLALACLSGNPLDVLDKGWPRMDDRRANPRGETVAAVIGLLTGKDARYVWSPLSRVRLQ